MRTRLGPLSLLAGCLLPVVGAFAIDTTALGLICVAAELLAFGWLLSEPRATAIRLTFGAFAALSIMATTWLYGGHDADIAVAAGLRILYIVLPSAILTSLIGPSELGDHLAQRLHLPARFVVGSVAALQRIESIGESWRQVQRSRRARGLGQEGNPARRIKELAAAGFAVLVLSMRHGSAMSIAMDSRGFADASTRTWAEAAPWRYGDTAMLLVAVLLAVGPWFID